MDLDDYIVQIFCEVDDFMKQRFPARSLRERGPLPKLADSEVLTLELVGESLGFETDQRLFWFFKRFYPHFFPHLTTRVTFLRQSANLWGVKQRLFQGLVRRFHDRTFVIDSLPLPVCRFARANRSRLFKGLAAYGKDLGQTIYGFRLHVKINSLGLVEAFELAPANIHDVHLAPELTAQDVGLLLGDRAYESSRLRARLPSRLHLVIPLLKADSTPAGRRRFLLRRKIETVFSQFQHYFTMKKIWARDLWHLTNRILRKILAHCFSVILCIQQGFRPLQLSKVLCSC